VRNGITEEEG